MPEREKPNLRTLGGQFIAGDPLRAVAALWIVSYHVFANALTRTTDRRVGMDFDVSLGEIGHVIARARFSVWIFFALSGYLLGRPFIQRFITGGRMPRLKPYFRNRALRILPVFFIVLLATLLLRGRNGASWGEVAITFGFGQIYDVNPFGNAIPQAWTLDNEIIFYVLLPAMGLLAARLFGSRGSHDARAWGVVGFLLLTAVLSLLYRIETQTDPLAVNYYLPGVWFSFVAGMLAAATEPLLRDRVQTERAGRIGAYALAGVALAMLAAYIWNDSLSVVPPTLYSFFGCYAILMAPLMLQWTTGRCWRFLDNRVMHWLGERSYSFYLWHVLIFVGLGQPLPEFDSPWATVIVLLIPAFAVSALVAEVSYRWIELPFLRRKHLWRRGEQARPGVEAAGAPIAPRAGSRVALMRPLFLFSLPRSGSTLVQRVLGAHPQIATAAEPWVLLPLLYATRGQGARAVYWHESAAEAVGDFVARLDGGRATWHEELRAFVTALYSRAGGEGHAYFLDKTPRYHSIAAEIMELFPDARFIFLWRHPLAVLSSCLETFRAGRFEPYHFEADLYGGVDALVEAHGRADSRAFTVRYEDLVSGGAPAWAELFAFLELDFDPALVERLSASKPEGRYGDPTGVNAYDRIEATPVTKWTGSLGGPVRAAWCRRYLAWIGPGRMGAMGYSLPESLSQLSSSPAAGAPRDMLHLAASRRAAKQRARALALPEGPPPLGGAFEG